MNTILEMTLLHQYLNRYSKTPDSLRVEMPFLKERLPVFQNLLFHGPEKALHYWVNTKYNTVLIY